jgi:hypothetical protein
MELFDAPAMSLARIEDARVHVEEIVANFRQERSGTGLRVRYRVNARPLQDDFPSYFNPAKDLLLCWIERASMRMFNPGVVVSDSIAVTFSICLAPKFQISARFNTRQTIRDLVRFANVFFKKSARGSSARLSLFLDRRAELIGINEDSEIALDELAEVGLLEKVWISIDNTSPQGQLVARVVAFQTDVRFSERQMFEVPVYFGDTIEKVLDEGKRILDLSEVVLWAVTTDGEMLPLDDRNADLIEIVDKYPDLRVERAPDANSQTFLLVDADGQSVAPPFQCALFHGETANELANRVREYLNVGDKLVIAFRMADGTITRPEMPYDEVPPGKFVVLAMTA